MIVHVVHLRNQTWSWRARRAHDYNTSICTLCQPKNGLLREFYTNGALWQDSAKTGRAGEGRAASRTWPGDCKKHAAAYWPRKFSTASTYGPMTLSSEQ